ncbi:nitroreductase family protein [Bifidobacterium avesanii]|uniref:Nitroreductase n=1 Tax=Bifidobacterium avesanii TaxID=1798157 RepID=A0A7K3TER9_9BIFI|nr:nitroreductase family protein [Bifidobacterium avesanii]KAB8295527.1 nitroreductase [Bifidobacterium avesanii]NEG77532.1 nitroreductase [Bifidobacterium avesanii]
MNIIEAMSERHAVRDYSDRPIDGAVLDSLRALIAELNERHDLNIQLVHDDGDAFGECPTHYGRFKGVRYCIALVGPEHGDPAALDERAGYCGERLALEAVALGLDTGWAVLHESTEHSGAWSIADGERMPAVIAIGHGNRPGRPHRSKPVEDLGAVENADGSASGSLDGAPEWFVKGLEAVQLAPSALGKQPVRFTLLADGRTVRGEALDGVQAEICLGVAKLHFELGAGGDNFVWA